ncbi:MAG TPA: hypothetical protein VFV08_01180, partial [Puia sp.]|nr:hypothetical protein [Puia sp.]
TSLLFYIFYLFTLVRSPIEWGWRGWADFYQATNLVCKYFFRFFIVTHDLDFMGAYNPTALSYLVDTVGRIVIGYGIYQTIQAFRKYGK